MGSQAHEIGGTPMLSDEAALELQNNVLFQYTAERMAEITPDTRFAHYTSADVAMQIIKAKPENRSLWLRNATEMNDFSEVEFGQHCLMQALSDPALAKRLKDATAAIHPDLLTNAVKAMDEENRRIKATTYLLSLALHRGEELTRGKLSMWRAYGGSANVCLILNTAAFTTPSTAYDVILSPVLYEGEAGFKRELERLVGNLEDNRDALKQVRPDDLELNLKRALDFAVLSTKHPGFAEEDEWRIIYRTPAPGELGNVPSMVVNVGGIVQMVHYLPMRNIPESGLHNAELNELLDRIIIGPTPNIYPVYDGFVRLLAEAGFDKPHERVIPSGIPLRR